MKIGEYSIRQVLMAIGVAVALVAVVYALALASMLVLAALTIGASGGTD